MNDCDKARIFHSEDVAWLQLIDNIEPGPAGIPRWLDLLAYAEHNYGDKDPAIVLICRAVQLEAAMSNNEKANAWLTRGLELLRALGLAHTAEYEEMLAWQVGNEKQQSEPTNIARDGDRIVITVPDPPFDTTIGARQQGNTLRDYLIILGHFDGNTLLAAHEEDPGWRQMFSTGNQNPIEFLEGLADYIMETYGPIDPVLITIHKLLFREAQGANDSHLAGMNYLDVALKLSEEIGRTDCLEYGECLSYLGMIYVEEENPLAVETLGCAIQVIEEHPPGGLTGSIYDELPGLKSYFADVIERNRLRQTEPVSRSKIDVAAELLNRIAPKTEGNTPLE